MDGPWDFLEPWRSVLCARLLAREPRKDFNVAIITPCSSHAGRDAAERFTVKAEIPVDANWRNSAESQLFREAIEIFTFVFKVNCSKFRELLTGNLPQPSSEHQLVWELWPVGVLPQVNRPPTWGALLGGFDNSWVYSSEFRSAMRELDTLGKCEIGDFRGSELQWTCAFPASRIQGRQMIDESEDSRSFKLSSLLDLGVPPIVEQFVKQGEAAMAHISNRSRVEYNESPGGDMTSSASALCQYVAAKEVDFAKSMGFTEMVAALARTPMSTFTLQIADGDEDSERDSPSVVENSGLALNTLLRGRLMCQLPEECQSTITFAKYNTCDLLCGELSNGVFAAICSTIAELPSDKQLNTLEVFSVSGNRWEWLVYMLRCSSSVTGLRDLSMIDARLTKADVAAMRVVLETGYPSSTSPHESPEYGFVSIPEGADLWAMRMEHPGSTCFVSAEALSCRARHCPAISSDNVEAVVPGYGICMTKVGDEAASFQCDSSELAYQSECRLRSLGLHMGRIELDTLVLDLLRFIGGDLRTLSIQLDESNPDEEYDTAHVADIDLCVLAAVCPKLEVLELICFDVVVQSANDDALRRWPIKTMNIIDSFTLPSLQSYLSNPATRMARGLTRLQIFPPEGEEFSEAERNKLEAHDGEYLPITKEKFPTEAKIAMLSTMPGNRTTSDSGVKPPAVHQLDADTFSIIFSFAATPVQRSVHCAIWPGCWSLEL